MGLEYCRCQCPRSKCQHGGRQREELGPQGQPCLFLLGGCGRSQVFTAGKSHCCISHLCHCHNTSLTKSTERRKNSFCSEPEDTVHHSGRRPDSPSMRQLFVLCPQSGREEVNAGGLQLSSRARRTSPTVRITVHTEPVSWGTVWVR